ncbi:nucleotidyltransferase [Dokdonia sinensis]|uniref:Nucleotidyltransferase n=1 Tax=Dokdonia sinensis TaxID=2479847 RepID=A0A3M0GMH1_9FLAO|nr:sugar phosphate nucleotidyltransferase [Dokdonia sinensis]RMB63912.1 nucleotidyltransferase [Dokdonia sinensis]
MTEHLIILAGGASSRMKKSEDSSLSKDVAGQANTRSKALITLNNRPMLDYVLYNAREGGIKNVIIVISPNDALFKELYGDKDAYNSFNGLSISYAVQHIPEGREKPFGTADAVFQALEQYPEMQEQEFLVCNCDNLYSPQAFELLRKASAKNALINYDRDALDFSMERISRFALTRTHKNGYLTGIVEKPQSDEIEKFKDTEGKFRVSMNIFKFDGNLFYDYLKNCPVNVQRNEKELPTALLNMVADYPKSVKTIPLSEHVPDLTSKSDIKQMNAYLSNHFTSEDWTR